MYVCKTYTMKSGKAITTSTTSAERPNFSIKQLKGKHSPLHQTLFKTLASKAQILFLSGCSCCQKHISVNWLPNLPKTLSATGSRTSQTALSARARNDDHNSCAKGILDSVKWPCPSSLEHVEAELGVPK